MWLATTLCHIILCTIHLISCQENINAESENALEATIGQFPYQAYIKIKTNEIRGDDVQYVYTLCSGSIINERWILTTAKCMMEAKSPMDVHVTVGTIRWDEEPVDGTFKALDIYIHDEYNKNTMQNNLALIYLDNGIIFSNSASSIEIPNTDDITVDGTVTGWALNKFPSETLLYSEVTIISDEKCEEFFTDDCEKCYTYNRTTNFCTDRPPSEDNGSPFAVNNAGHHLQMGIISLHFKCNITEISLYLDVSKYSDWIRATQASEVTTTTLNADTTETAVETSTSTVTTALTTVASSLSSATSTLTVDTTTLSSLNTEDTSQSFVSTTFTTQNSDTTTTTTSATTAVTSATTNATTSSTTSAITIANTSSVMTSATNTGTSESPTTLNVDSSSLTSDYNSQQTSTPFTSSNAATATTVTTIHTSSTVKPSTTPQKPVNTSPAHTTTTTSTRRPFFTTPSNSKRITLKRHLVLILTACTLIIMHINFKSLF